MMPFIKENSLLLIFKYCQEYNTIFHQYCYIHGGGLIQGSYFNYGQCVFRIKKQNHITIRNN